MISGEITLPFRYKIEEKPSFDLMGFTKVVASGGEQYDEIRKSGKWEVLRQIAGADKTIYGIASFDRECPKGFYRYTLAVRTPIDLTQWQDEEHLLFPFHVKPSVWCIFTLEHFVREYGHFWEQDPYKMIEKLGWAYNNAVGIHLDVYAESYLTDDDAMEFWMPVKTRKA